LSCEFRRNAEAALGPDDAADERTFFARRRFAKLVASRDQLFASGNLASLL